MKNIKWIKIILFILKLLAEGMSEENAVGAASVKFGVSTDRIWRHGGL